MCELFGISSKENCRINNYLKEFFSHSDDNPHGWGLACMEYKNCHPYTMKDISSRHWTLIHNGTIFEYSLLNKYINVQQGDTDSERILFYIVELINQIEIKLQRELDKKERFQLLDSIIVKMSKGNKLNLMLYDGELLYIHTNYANSLYKLEQKNKILFCTVPLSEGKWQPVAFTTLLAYKDGKQVFQGTKHNNEYIDNEYDIKFLYSIFSDL